MKMTQSTKHKQGLASKETFFGHPRGLYVLFLTEMWERFSFYGMRALLILYLTKHFLFNDTQANHLYGSYLGLAYALPVIGGYLADRYLGFRKAVVFGGILLCLGHLGMAFEGKQAILSTDGSVHQEQWAVEIFFFSLALIAMGVGFLKPNISTIVGKLYASGDGRRDSGFTIFYMGINLGALLAELIVGYVGLTYGFGYGFGLAGIGMIMGLVVFLRGQPYLHGLAEAKDPALLHAPLFGTNWLGWLNRENLIYLLAVLGVLIGAQVLRYVAVIDWGLRLTLGIAFVCIAWRTISLSREERHRVLVVLVLTFFTVCFWALFEQAGSSMTLFADRLVNLDIGFMKVTAPMLQAVNPALIILLGPFFAAFWIWLNRRNWEPSISVKFGLGIIQAGLGFGVLVWGASMVDQSGKVAILWLVLAYSLHTTGELCLSPVGLSMVTKLTPGNMLGLMMGTWFLAMAFADFLAGQIAAAASLDHLSATHLDSVETLTSSREALGIYTHLFEQLFVVGLVVGVILLLVSPILRRMQHGIR